MQHRSWLLASRSICQSTTTAGGGSAERRVRLGRMVDQFDEEVAVAIGQRHGGLFFKTHFILRHHDGFAYPQLRIAKNPSKIYSVKLTFLCKLSGTPRKGWDNGHSINGSRVWLRGLPGW
jgi:hypothetical protein